MLMIFLAIYFLVLVIPGSSTQATLCVDLSRDCERRKDLCALEEHSSTMHQACPRTCNLCNDTFPSLTQFAPRRKCEDEASDCEESLELCDNLMFRNLMRKQCAYSCGFCSGRYQPTTKKPKIATKKRGKSKSRRVKEEDDEEEEEDEISIIDVMKLIRGHETTEGTTASTSTSTTTTTTTTTVTTLPCRDRAIDCQAKAGLCDHRNYQNLMRRICRKTCGYC